MELSSYYDNNSINSSSRKVNKTMAQISEFFRQAKIGQKEFGEDIATVINSILLSIVYFLGFGATFILSRIMKKKFLSNKIDKSADSYWERLNLGKKQMEEYYRQF